MVFGELGDLILCFTVRELGEGNVRERRVLSHIRSTVT